MATLVQRKDKGFEIHFYTGRTRRYVSLSGRRYGEATATELKKVIETLLYYESNSITTLDKKTLAWIQAASPEIQRKLAAVGLIVKPESHTVEELWEKFLQTKTDIKPATMETYDDTKRRFFAFFKPSEMLEDLTTHRMTEWKGFLKSEIPREGTKKRGLAESTVAGTLSKMKAVLNWAVGKGWPPESPLKGVGRGSFVNPANDRFVTMDEYQRLLEAAPCQDWRTILALVRIGGLRCPSEVLRLRWTDINWEKSRFYVKSPKTERYNGKGGRLVPLFPGLRKELERLFEDERSEGTEFVINRYRDPERTNLGTQFSRIVQLAGVEEIKRPFDNMRASRSTEVYAEFGAFLESKWIGHSTKTAMKHYLQVREIDFELATGNGAGNGSSGEKDNFQRSEKSFQREFQPQGVVNSRMESQQETKKEP